MHLHSNEQGRLYACRWIGSSDAHGWRASTQTTAALVPRLSSSIAPGCVAPCISAVRVRARADHCLHKRSSSNFPSAESVCLNFKNRVFNKRVLPRSQACFSRGATEEVSPNPSDIRMRILPHPRSRSNLTQLSHNIHHRGASYACCSTLVPALKTAFLSWTRRRYMLFLDGSSALLVDWERCHPIPGRA